MLAQARIHLRAALFILFALAPLSAQADSCRLGEAERAQLRALLEALPEYPYSDFGFPYWNPRNADMFRDYGHLNRANFPIDATGKNLLSPDGSLFLFRNIGGSYVKGFTGKHSGKQQWIESEGLAYSYSLNPSIIHGWSQRERKKSLTLIAWQNIEDGLTYPSETSREMGGPFRPPFTARTLLKDITYYDEVKVPVAKENVLAVMRQTEFAKIFAPFEHKIFRLRSIMNLVIASPELLRPDCNEDL